jgi:hypothetical protein
MVVHQKLIDGILYRVINTNGELVRQLVLPETCIATVMTSLHDDMGHQGRVCLAMVVHQLK